MKILKLALSLFVLLPVITKAQSAVDTLFANNEKTPCVVKEITEDAVRYSYIGEDLVNTVSKNMVQKIVFKSGRIQKFTNSTSFKILNSVLDYEKVSISQVEGEVKGLFKVGEVTSKAVGTTTLSSMQNVRDRAYVKLKIEAAMRGANIIYLTQQFTTGNQPGNYFTPAKATETNLSGIAYSSVIPNFDQFKARMSKNKDKVSFESIRKFKLWTSSGKLKEDETKEILDLEDFLLEDGNIYVLGKLDGKESAKFRVVYFNDDTFTIMYQNKSSILGETIFNEEFKW